MVSTAAVAKDPYRKKWAMVWLIFAIECIQFIGYTAYGTQSGSIMEQMGLSYGEFGNLASISTVAIGITILFVGIMGDYWSVKKPIIGGLALMGLGQVLFGAADSYTMLLVARAIEGVGIAGVVGGGYTLAEKWTANSSAAGASYSIMLCADGGGGILSLYGFAIVMSVFGWRMGSYISAIIYAVCIVICLIWLKDYPDQAASAKRLREVQPNPLKSLGKIAVNRTVLGCAAIVVGQTAAYCVVTFWIPTILMEGAGWSDAMSGLLANLYPIVAIPFMIAIPKLAEGKNTKRIMLVLGLIAVGLFFGLAGTSIANSYIIMVILMACLGVFNYMNSTLAFGYAARSVGVEHAGLCTQFIQLLGFGLGGSIFPMVIGYARDATGSYEVGFIVMAIACIVLMVLLPLMIKYPLTEKK